MAVSVGGWKTIARSEDGAVWVQLRVSPII